MKSFIRRLIIISLLLQANFLLADIYRSQDDSGRVQFSDRPTADATVIIPSVRAYRYKHTVVKVYDGDTLVLKNGERVRLLGINTPEIDSYTQQGQAGGQQAKLWLETKLHDVDYVYIEYDQQQRDKYNRLLAHVFLADGEHINLSLVAMGFATLSIIPPNINYVDAFQAAEMTAEKNRSGVWAMAEYQALPLTSLVTEGNKKGWHRYWATPTDIAYSRSYVRLILNNKVTIRIPIKNITLFPALTDYLNKKIEVRGWVNRQGDSYSILVRHPTAIIFL